jgi:ankyrin repeat protein
VYCQLVHICGCLPARIRHALADLPETLDETYERTLREINKADWEFAHRLFQFVAVAVRPLFVEELAELLAFDFEEGLIPKFRENWRLEDPMHAVLSSCCSFLALVENKSYISPRKVVQFSHFSVKEFLTSTRLAEANDTILRRYHISETPAHTLAARACLGYLLHLDEDIIKDGLKKLPFIRYSAEYWVDHARLENVSRNVSDGMKELFDPSKPHLAFHVRIRAGNPVFYHVGQSGPPPLSGTRLHYAVLWDLPSMTEIIVNEEHSQNVNSHDFTNSATPLHLASKSGHLEVARILIEGGADVSALDDDGRTTLHLASQSGHLEVARMLVERDADVSAQDDDGRTTLHLASKSGHLEVARILIEGGADVSAQDEDGRTPLHLASKAGRLEVARMLIERGADVSALDNEGQTPLQVASGAGEPEVAHMLIERGAAVLTQDEGGWTPLHQASHGDWNGTSGHLEVARMLIECGADLSARDKDDQTALHLALQAVEPETWKIECTEEELADCEGELEVAKLKVARMLIERGADLSAQDKDGRTALHLAMQAMKLKWCEPEEKLAAKLRAAKLEVARMLIERGVDLSAQDKDGLTVLHLALQAVDTAFQLDGEPVGEVEAAKLEVARMLIERGADLSAQDKDGQTVLHLALQAVGMKMWIPEVVELASVAELAELVGELEAEKLKVALMLIERGVDVSAQDKEGRTALHLASHAGRLEVAHMLIEHGAGVSAQDKDDRTPIHLASQAEQLEVVCMHSADTSV